MKKHIFISTLGTLASLGLAQATTVLHSDFTLSGNNSGTGNQLYGDTATYSAGGITITVTGSDSNTPNNNPTQVSQNTAAGFSRFLGAVDLDTETAPFGNQEDRVGNTQNLSITFSGSDVILNGLSFNNWLGAEDVILTSSAFDGLTYSDDFTSQSTINLSTYGYSDASDSFIMSITGDAGSYHDTGDAPTPNFLQFGLDGNDQLYIPAGTTITMSVADANNTTGVGLHALDITPVPEPSSTALLGLSGLALILRRRK